MEKMNRQAAAGRRDVQSRNDRAARSARRERVRIEQNDYREPNKLLQKLSEINWCKAILCVVAIYAVVTIGAKIFTISAQKNRQRELLEQQAVLEQQLSDLQKEADYVGSEEYIEQAAREKFGWVKEGEIVFKEKNTAE